ncbi:MAG: hypothetical protein IT303_04735 [Dehalococcoidia bacterium]|nr:hypothetical protein [Dehalococcoidia bacterium]
MSYERPVLLIFHGAAGDGPAEQVMARARVAAAVETARSALAAGFEAVIIATDAPDAFGDVPAGVLTDPDDGSPFDFAGRLRGLVQRFGLRRPAVMGSGSVPLLGVDELRLIVEQLDARDGRFVTNNFFSADLTAWTPGEAVFATAPFERDNSLPRRLRDDAGLSPVILPRTTATQFDLDTPADLAVLALSEELAPGLRAAIAGLELPLERYRALMRLFCDRGAEVVVAGRVGSAAWQHLERETACRVRMFSEERGMAAAGRDHRARSLLGFLLDEVGPERFFQRMAELGDALVLDTRVLEAHAGVAPSREDRFASDLFWAEAIADPFLRALTQAAAAAPMPVLLGGHSLVSGGLMLLNDIAWRENDRRLGI